MIKASSLLFPSVALAIACGGVVLACNVDADIAKNPASATRDASAPRPDPTSDHGVPALDAGPDVTVPPAPEWQEVKSVRGGVVIASWSGSAAARQLWPLAVFDDGTAKSTCASRVIPSGARTCTVSRCTVATESATSFPHAGAIDFGGLATITPNASGLYMSSTATPPWIPGTSIALNAAGGAIPAFTGTIALPEDLTVTSPPGGVTDATIPFPTALSKSAGLHVAWQPGGPAGEIVQVAIQESYATKPPMYQVGIACLAPRGDGALDVPAAALSYLSELPLASGGPNVTVNVNTHTEQIKTVGTYRVQLVGLARGVSMTATDKIVP